jgi:hypothetical protein
MPRLLPSVAVVMLVSAAVPRPGQADAGVAIGARTGAQLLDGNALFVGADVRLSFELSPLIVSVTYDHFVLEDETLFQVGASALYDLPTAAPILQPYLGAGVGVTRFEVPEEPGVQDANGMRIGLNLIGGLRFEHVDVPVVRPFAQVVVTLGPIDLFTIGGGVLFELAGG